MTAAIAAFQAAAGRNLDRLRQNRYPGRGIVIGLTPDGSRMMQVYWIMGRSENSRNRVFVQEENGFVRTEAADPAKLTDPSLIIYYPARHHGGVHIVTNGDQTDTVWEAVRNGGSFENALSTRTFEPDGPNFTPRISGMIDLNDNRNAYKLSILKTTDGNPAQTQRHYFHYGNALAGYGHCIHTYQGDGEPLPSFAGEPYPVPLQDGLDATAIRFWEALDEENKISMLVKTIRLGSGETELRILNKN